TTLAWPHPANRQRRGRWRRKDQGQDRRVHPGGGRLLPPHRNIEPARCTRPITSICHSSIARPRSHRRESSRRRLRCLVSTRPRTDQQFLTAQARGLLTAPLGPPPAAAA